MAQPAPLITQGIGPSGAIKYILTLGLDLGVATPDPIAKHFASAGSRLSMSAGSRESTSAGSRPANSAGSRGSISAGTGSRTGNGTGL